MNATILHQTEARRGALGHQVHCLMEGRMLAYGRCVRCGEVVRIESGGGSYRAVGPALEKACRARPGQAAV